MSSSIESCRPPWQHQSRHLQAGAPVAGTDLSVQKVNYSFLPHKKSASCAAVNLPRPAVPRHAAPAYPCLALPRLASPCLPCLAMPCLAQPRLACHASRYRAIEYVEPHPALFALPLPQWSGWSCGLLKCRYLPPLIASRPMRSSQKKPAIAAPPVPA